MVFLLQAVGSGMKLRWNSRPGREGIAAYIEEKHEVYVNESA